MRRQNESAHWLSKHTRALFQSQLFLFFVFFFVVVVIVDLCLVRRFHSFGILLPSYIIKLIYIVISTIVFFQSLNSLFTSHIALNLKLPPGKKKTIQRKIPRTWKWKIQKEKVREHFLILLTLILNWVSIIINWNDWESLANYVFALKVHLDCYIVFLFRCGCCFVFEFHCNCLVSTNTHYLIHDTKLNAVVNTLIDSSGLVRKIKYQPIFHYLMKSNLIQNNWLYTHFEKLIVHYN